jgi:DNA-directed RNA polymerase subunit RPC12/RpoP
MKKLNRDVKWAGNKITASFYTCANCGRDISSDYGMQLETFERDYNGKPEVYSDGNIITSNEAPIGVYICTNCGFPTFIGVDEQMNLIQIPKSSYGSDIKGISDDVEEIYNEARHSYGVEAYTGVIELCRSLLNHVAVDLGAPKGKRFIEYVNYLDDNHYISVRSKEWVDKIRKLGNSANHDLTVFSQDDAKLCLKFVEMILKSNYEYPSLLEDN